MQEFEDYGSFETPSLIIERLYTVTLYCIYLANMKSTLIAVLAILGLLVEQIAPFGFGGMGGMGGMCGRFNSSDFNSLINLLLCV